MLLKSCTFRRYNSLLRSLPTSQLLLCIRHYASESSPSSRTRNIGIIAHIDAGKTTTTERMLYYSGYTRSIGDVDDGSTVTDFLPAERARGITIQSAAITFDWPPKPAEPEVESVVAEVENGLRPQASLSHTINLIDTPGHADFTFEVRRSLRILDGAVCVLDAVEGVEAQSEQVWKQASEWQIPRIVFVNKLDRTGAEFATAVTDVASKLGGSPAVCQIPWWEGSEARFTGIGDVINLRGLLYPDGGDGKAIETFNLQELHSREPAFAFELERARIALIELLSEHDEAMVDLFLESDENHLAIPGTAIWKSLRRCLLDAQKVIPLFAGASFRNIGVQPLLDAIVNLLPGPEERPDAEISIGSTKAGLQDLLQGNLVLPPTPEPKKKTKIIGPREALEGCALAFKVVNDPRKGVLVYVRVYSGAINRGISLFNTNLNTSEKATTLLRMYASDSIQVQSIEAGQIGVITGLKHARTGDTLVAYHGHKAPPSPLNRLQLRPIQVPPPVFFASIEPHSLSDQKDMQDKLALLLREDPSLHISDDEHSGQLLLSGMGELHLEIARNRLVDDFKAKASMGAIEIGYQETIKTASEEIEHIAEREMAGKKSQAGCVASVDAYDDSTPFTPPTIPENTELWSEESAGNRISIISPLSPTDQTPNFAHQTANLSLADIRSALSTGALAGLSRGPGGLYGVRGVHVVLALRPERHLFGPETNFAALTLAARTSTRLALQDAAGRGGTALVEPVMDVTVSVDEASLGVVVNDIASARGGHVYSLDDEGGEPENGPRVDIPRVYAPPDPFGSRAKGDGVKPRARSIKAKVPLKEMVGYLKVLRSLTGGRGTFVMSVDRFEKMSRKREKIVLGRF